MKNILDTKFRHHSWFKNSGLTKRQAIEHFAECGDFQLSKKPSKTQSNNLFDEVNYDPILIYCGKQRSSYNLSEEEKEYYLKRREFWTNFDKRMNEEYSNNWMEKGNTSKGYSEWLEYKRTERMKIPEYVDYITAFKKSA